MHKHPRHYLGKFFFKCAMFFAFLVSLNPYFLWSLGYNGYLFSLILILISSVISNRIFCYDKQCLPAIVLLFLYNIYLRVVNDANIFGYMFIFVDWYILSRLFIVNDELKAQTIVFIAKALSVICLISMVGFLLFILGKFIPPYDVQFNEGQYEYLNYTFFLLNYENIMDAIPRFHGIFLEPAHIGVASTMLLTALSFDFSKWYTKILLLTVIITFSLASYVLLTVGLLFQYRVKLEGTLKSIFLLIGVVIICYLFAINYNNGDNMLNNLIVERLKFSDGNLAGDNRVGLVFKKDYEEFLLTDKIWFGSKYEPIRYYGGNAGYRVYIYENGFVGLFLIILFYLTCMKGYSFKTSLPLFFMYVMIFWKGGTPLWYNLIIPYICGLSMISNNNSIK